MAHGFFKSFIRDIEVHSAGTKPAERVNPKAIEVMKEVGIDLSSHRPKSVEIYLNDAWDYVITVCGGANESCPNFIDKVGKRLHFGFDDPSDATGTDEFVMKEFRRVRDEIQAKFKDIFL